MWRVRSRLFKGSGIFVWLKGLWKVIPAQSLWARLSVVTLFGFQSAFGINLHVLPAHYDFRVQRFVLVVLR